MGVGSTTVFACGRGVGGGHSSIIVSSETIGAGVGSHDTIVSATGQMGEGRITVSATGRGVAGITGVGCGRGFQIQMGRGVGGGHSSVTVSSETIGAGVGSQDTGGNETIVSATGIAGGGVGVVVGGHSTSITIGAGVGSQDVGEMTVSSTGITGGGVGGEVGGHSSTIVSSDGTGAGDGGHEAGGNKMSIGSACILASRSNSTNSDLR
jgi:hypothetical protein